MYSSGRGRGKGHGGRSGRGVTGTRICNTFQATGTCTFGSQCKFAHSGNSSQQQGQQRPVPGTGPPCHSFQSTGSCKFGTTCRYKHDASSGTGRAYTNAAGGNAVGGKGTAQAGVANDSRRFLQQLSDARMDRLSVKINEAEDLWLRCWSDASTFGLNELHILLVVLAKIPLSTLVPIPPLQQWEDATVAYLKKSKAAAHSGALH
eukprot:2630454-Prymnesium_polylepis.2